MVLVTDVSSGLIKQKLPNGLQRRPVGHELTIIFVTIGEHPVGALRWTSRAFRLAAELLLRLKATNKLVCSSFVEELPLSLLTGQISWACCSQFDCACGPKMAYA